LRSAAERTQERFRLFSIPFQFSFSEVTAPEEISILAIRSLRVRISATFLVEHISPFAVVHLGASQTLRHAQFPMSDTA
jgi:hypothetical protein